MSRADTAREIARERANNLVRAIEAAKSARHALALVNAYGGDGEVAVPLDRAKAAITHVEDILHRKARRG